MFFCNLLQFHHFYLTQKLRFTNSGRSVASAFSLRHRGLAVVWLSTFVTDITGSRSGRSEAFAEHPEMSGRCSSERAVCSRQVCQMADVCQAIWQMLPEEIDPRRMAVLEFESPTSPVLSMGFTFAGGFSMV